MDSTSAKALLIATAEHLDPPAAHHIEISDLPAAMTIPAFCRWAGIGRTMAYAQAKAGHLKFRKVGAKKTIVLRADAEEWLRSLPAASS
ncbi:conserved hypothetical protein [Bradyrhizobium sp. ORS 375]|uniref:helix-turn-helix transcriptional regulator n=1 Tax=unclassified Bradyrhizobium TaxID=2631580 RepID=UPI0002408AC7|nr:MULTISPECIES: helix-turn-helix domain-containing protein [unclassified Bradyrhizobium]CCD90952.1 conserved hypothetical protein [Bradyrhizobium sp. ORS 375]